MSKYAEKTTVSSDKSRSEIEKALSRYGASKFMYAWEEKHACIAFEMHGLRIKFLLPLPSLSDPNIRETPTGKERSQAQIEAAYEQAVKQRWRALFLVIKAKLEAVLSGITMFEDEFMAHVVLPDNSTARQYFMPQIKNAYKSGKMPEMLPLLEVSKGENHVS